MNENTNVSSSATASPAPSSGEERDEAALALTSKVATGARDLTDEAKQVAGDVMDQAKKSAEISIASGKDRAAESLGDVAGALRQAGQHLRSQDKAGLTDYVVRAADKVEAASLYLQRRTLSDVLGDVGGFARREPALFLGGAFALGVLGGRFLKSTGSRSANSANSNSARSTSSLSSNEASPRTAGGDQDFRGAQPRDPNRRQERGASEQRRGSNGGNPSDEKRGNGGRGAKAPGAM